MVFVVLLLLKELENLPGAVNLKNLSLNISCYFGRRDIIHWISPYSTQQAVNLPTVWVGLGWIIYSFSNKYTQKEHKELLLWLDM